MKNIPENIETVFVLPFLEQDNICGYLREAVKFKSYIKVEKEKGIHCMKFSDKFELLIPVQNESDFEIFKGLIYVIENFFHSSLRRHLV